MHAQFVLRCSPFAIRPLFLCSFAPLPIVAIARPFWNSRERRLRALWRLVLGLAVIAVSLFAAALGMRLLSASEAVAGTLGSGGLHALDVVLRLLAVVGGVWLACRFVDRREFASLGMRPDARWWTELGFGTALGAALVTGVFVALWSTGSVVVVGWFVFPAEFHIFWLAAIAAVLAHGATGILEELILRAYPLRNLAEGLRRTLGTPKRAVTAAYVTTSVVFGLLHLLNPNATLAAGLNVILAGLVLGFAYVCTGRLALSIGLHASWNLFLGSVYGFPVSGDADGTTVLLTATDGPAWLTGGAFGPEAGVATTIALLAGLAAIAVRTRLRAGTVRIRSGLACYRRRPRG